MNKILVIDDMAAIRTVLKEELEREKYEVEEAKDGEEALKKLRTSHYDVAFCDIKMPKLDGVGLLEKIKSEEINTPFIMISAHGDDKVALHCIKMGAYFYLSKPFESIDVILIHLRNIIERSNLKQQNSQLKKKINKKFNVVGQSMAINEVKNMIDKVAPTEARVLITGPTGSGKELVARWIHEKSNRSKTAMVEVNCAAIPSELIESELFGHEKGAFTSAVKQHIGKFEQANGATLFLDEVGDMSLSAQSKVLRVLEENKITRVGGDKEIKVNVRIISATNKNLKQAIADHKFREDLYHRLGVILIKVPPLKDRKEDIPILIDEFLKDIANEYGTKPKSITKQAIEVLQKLDWAGNIRELRNVVERLVIMCNNKIDATDVSKYIDVK